MAQLISVMLLISVCSNARLGFFGQYCKSCHRCPIRMCLVDIGYFGDVNLSVQQRLDVAFKRFKEFCRSRKIQSSQPPFTEKMEP